MHTFLFKENKEIFQILKGYKKATARNINNNNKNIKVNDYISMLIGFQQIAVLKITDIKISENISNENANLFKKLGYKTKKQYFSLYPSKKNKKQIIFSFDVISYDLNKYIENTKKM